MGKWTKFIGILGAVFLVFGLISIPFFSIFAGEGVDLVKQFLPLTNLVVGGLLCLLWFISSISQGSLSATGKDGVLTGRRARYGYNVVLYTVVFVGLLGVVNWFVTKHDKRWDLTEEHVYSLSDQSVKVIENLKSPLKIVAFKTPEIDENRTQDLLELYKHHNTSKVTAELIDPRTKPTLVDTYEMKQGNIVYIEYGEGDKKGVSRLNEVSEQAITNAVLKLAHGEAKKIYYIQGHNEPDLKAKTPDGLDNFSSAISDEHLTMEPILLAEKGSVPNDAAAIILVSPKKPLLPQERDALIKYTEDGGRLLLLTDPRTTDDIKTIADHFGITVGNDVVIDQVQRLFAGPTLGAQPIVRTYGTHPITKGFTQAHITVYNVASSVTIKDKSAKDVTLTELAKTGPQAWAETNLAGVFDAEQPTAALDDQDVKGPVSLAVAYEKKISPSAAAGQNADSQEPKVDKVARLVVFGDSDFILNPNFDVYANRDLILNSINWLAGEEGGVTIRPKSMKSSKMQPIKADTFSAILASSFVVPELILIFGLIIWWRRRSVLA